MHEGQIKDYDYLVANGATWMQAMTWCNSHLLGYSSQETLRDWLVTDNVGTG